jgi:hypothetical protein
MSVPLNGDSVISNFIFNVDLSALSTGLHSLFVRSRDANGKWSVVNQQFVYKFPALSPTNAVGMQKLEYFIDSDPGLGNAMSVPLNGDSVISNFMFNVDLSSLSTGLHSLFVRSRDANGKWSIVNQQYVYKFKPLDTAGLALITRLEYFVDTDPGYGNATTLSIPSDSFISNIAFSLDTSGLSYGSHVLYVRSRDANGRWSVVNSIRFSRDNLKLYLQGYYTSNGSMQPALFNQGIGMDASITDSVEVELRNSSYPYILRAKTSALLKTDGSMACTFMNLYGSFYIVIKHRNSITTWSAAPVAIGNFPTTYDFTSAANKAYGSNQKAMGGGKWAIYTGDLDRDDNIDLLDAAMLQNDINSFSYGYFGSDINGDGNVDLLDGPIMEANISNFIFSSHP